MGFNYKNRVLVECAQKMRCNRVQLQSLQATAKRASRLQGVSNLNVYMREYDNEMKRMFLCVWVVGRYDSVHVECKGCRESRNGFLH